MPVFLPFSGLGAYTFQGRQWTFQMSSPQKNPRSILDALAAHLVLHGTAVVGSSLPLGSMASTGSGRPKEVDPEKVQRAADHRKLRRIFEQMYDTKAEKIRKPKTFSALESYAVPDKGQIAVPPKASPAIMAHELGHLANWEQSKNSPLHRMFQRATGLSYGPAIPAASLGASGALVGSTRVPEHADLLTSLGYGGVGAAGVLGSLQLLEEARASLKARRALKKLRGDEYKEKELLPLAAGLGTYGSAASASVAVPLLLHHLYG